jgi:hypothetical protein
MDHVLIWIGLSAIAYIVWKLVAGIWTSTDRQVLFTLPKNVQLESQPLLTDGELLLYNLVRMAVQDHYLVFARVPLLRVLRIEAEGTSRLRMLRRVALKHLDFVLVHPGSRKVEQVIQLDEGSEDEREKAKRQEIQTMVQAAGIRLTMLKTDYRYTVQQLETMLGISAHE